MSPDVAAVVVRRLRGEDRAAWDPLWQGYLDFYDEVVDQEVTDVVFQRLADRGWSAQAGYVASVDGALAGFAHVGLQPSTWSTQPDAYLEDLYVAPAARGAGVGRALIEHLVTTGRDAGWRKVHWLTETDNTTARQLYDRIGGRQDQVRYTIDL